MKHNENHCRFVFQFNFSFLWFCLSCLFPYRPSDYFYIGRSLPSSLFLFSISPSYHTCSLFQSWAASKLLCAVCLCVTSSTLHTHTNRSMRSNTQTLPRMYTQQYFKHAAWVRYLSFCFCAPWGGSQCSVCAFHTLTLVLSSQCGPVQHGTAWQGTLQLSTACDMPTKHNNVQITPDPMPGVTQFGKAHHCNSWSVYSQTEIRATGQHAELWHMDGCYCTICSKCWQKSRSAETNSFLTDVFYSGLIISCSHQTPPLDLSIVSK